MRRFLDTIIDVDYLYPCIHRSNIRYKLWPHVLVSASLFTMKAAWPRFRILATERSLWPDNKVMIAQSHVLHGSNRRTGAGGVVAVTLNIETKIVWSSGQCDTKFLYAMNKCHQKILEALFTLALDKKVLTLAVVQQSTGAWHYSATSMCHMLPPF